MSAALQALFRGGHVSEAIQALTILNIDHCHLLDRSVSCSESAGRDQARFGARSGSGCKPRNGC